MLGAIAIATGVALLAVLLHPRVLASGTWRATSTPLASIIGSGFLIALPILSEEVGEFAILAMLGLLILAYAIGAAVRNNILHVEQPVRDGTAARPVMAIERLSETVLMFAYFVSVAYYLVLFSSFLLRLFGTTDAIAVKVTVTVLLALIGGVGFWRGFRAVERMEVVAVSAKLAVIGALLAAVTAYDLIEPHVGYDVAPSLYKASDLPVLLGMLVVVQGFETSRFLGAAYSPQVRVKTMKYAQYLSGAIYLLFFLVMTPLTGFAKASEGVTAIVDMLRPVSPVLPLIVTLGALASQSSAAVADSLGASGLLQSATSRRIPERLTYPLLALMSVLVTWGTNVYSLVALASRCFALYYAFQCLQAAMNCWSRGARMQAAGFAVLTLIAAAIVVFGAPAEGG